MQSKPRSQRTHKNFVFFGFFASPRETILQTISTAEEQMKTEFNKVNPEHEADKPKKCACRYGKIFAVILGILIIGAICWHVHPRSSGLKVGTDYIVQFRGDALGGPTSPFIDSYNGGQVNAGGTLIAVNREAILLEVVDFTNMIDGKPRKTQLWIPKSSILLIRTAM